MDKLVSLYKVTKVTFYLFLFAIVIFTNSCVVQHRPKPAPEPRITLSPHFDAKKYESLAIFVMDDTRNFRRSGALRQVEDEFMISTIKKGYILTTRSDIDKIKDELNLQKSDLTQEEVAEIGNILNVPAIIIVSVNQVNTERYKPIYQRKGVRYYKVSTNLSARMISTESAEVLWISSYTGVYLNENNGRDKEAETLGPVAKVVASGLPYRKNVY